MLHLMHVCVQSCFICVWLSVTLWTVAHQNPLSMGFSRQEYWSGMPCPPPGDLPDPGIEPASLLSSALAGRFFTTSATWKAPVAFHRMFQLSVYMYLMSKTHIPCFPPFFLENANITRNKKPLEMASLIFSRLKQLISNFYKIEMREKSDFNLQRESRKVCKKFLALPLGYLLQVATSIDWLTCIFCKEIVLDILFKHPNALFVKHFLRLGRVKEVKKQLSCESWADTNWTGWL